MTDDVPEKMWTVGGTRGHFFLARGRFATVEYVRADLALERAVEIVKAKRDEYDAMAAQTKDYEHGASLGCAVEMANEIIAALEAAKEG